jgi:hypothetical protein
MEITYRFGRPREVTSDRGRAFMSNIFMEVRRELFIKLKPVGTEELQANGIIGSANRTLLDIITTRYKGIGSK